MAASTPCPGRAAGGGAVVMLRVVRLGLPLGRSLQSQTSAWASCLTAPLRRKLRPQETIRQSVRLSALSVPWPWTLTAPPADAPGGPALSNSLLSVGSPVDEHVRSSPSKRRNRTLGKRRPPMPRLSRSLAALADRQYSPLSSGHRDWKVVWVQPDDVDLPTADDRESTRNRD